MVGLLVTTSSWLYVVTPSAVFSRRVDWMSVTVAPEASVSTGWRVISTVPSPRVCSSQSQELTLLSR
ncbi:hypothetical protein D3C87_2105750 [compost metagenome]